MVIYMGVDVDRLYEFNYEGYVHARDEFIAGASNRLAALSAHAQAESEQQNHTSDDTSKQLTELEYKSTSMYRQHSNFLKNLSIYQKLLHIVPSIGDDELLAYLIPLLPDLNTRRTLDFKTLKILDLQLLLEQEFSGTIESIEDVIEFIKAHRGKINIYATEDDSMSRWDFFVTTFNSAIMEKVLQNFYDYIAVIYRLGLKIDHASNEAYVAGLQAAYLIDLYLHIMPLNQGEIKEALEQTIKDKLRDSLDLLRAAPDPNHCLEHKNKRYSIVSPFYKCYQVKQKTLRDAKIAHEYPKKVKKSTFCGLSPW